MSTSVTAAVIAAVVSLAVAIISVVAAFLTTRATLRRDHDRQEADLKRTMTERLYDRRVAVYPGLFAATDPFRRSRLDEAPDLAKHLAEAAARVEEWHAREGGLLLSAAAYQRMLDLRNNVRRYLDSSDDPQQIQHLKGEIWVAKNRLREAMRADLGLLFDEDRY
jgi:hypothetical protein